jgi:hypothetical protein
MGAEKNFPALYHPRQRRTEYVFEHGGTGDNLAFAGYVSYVPGHCPDRGQKKRGAAQFAGGIIFLEKNHVRNNNLR